MFGGRAITIARIQGIEVRVGTSWLVIITLVTWSAWQRFDAEFHLRGVTGFAMAFLTAILFCSSILAHEVGHALEAKHRGMPVGGITLWLFGGVTETTLDAGRPIDEFAVTAIGPFTSLVAASVLGLCATAADQLGVHSLGIALGYVGWLNVALFVFNLLPGAPLDGGRIVRAIAWRITGDRNKATRIAAHSGRVLGSLLIALGLTQVFFVPAALINGLWFMMIGWFLIAVANAELVQARLERLLADSALSAGQLMHPVDTLASIHPDAPGTAALDDLLRDGVILVVDGTRPYGVLTPASIGLRSRGDRNGHGHGDGGPAGGSAGGTRRIPRER
jgi:Zn-dependent protease